MKRAIKRTVIALLLCVIGVSMLCSCCILRRQIITGDWSDPVVHFWTVRHSASPDRSRLVIHYHYTLTQTATLKYPHYVWKNTDWQRKITERLNTIAAGYGLAIVNGTNVEVFPLEQPISRVLWSNETAFCKAETRWFSIVGSALYPIPLPSTEPEGATNSLSEPEAMLPTTADRYPEIAEHLRKTNLGGRSRGNYYRPIKEKE